MKDLLCDEFQEAVDHHLIRHKSVLDVMSKLQESSARANRAITKAVTNCGCVRINAARQKVPSDLSSLRELRQYMQDHVQGKLCDHCKDILEAELGANLFYLAAMCNLFDLNLYDILIKERKRISTLGLFTFT